MPFDTPLRTRFAPSPTGDLHLGGAWVALASWALARASGGAYVVRVEDIDTPRVVPGSAERIGEDLAWLGLDEDEGPSRGGPCGPYVQSARTGLYDRALAFLAAAGLVYPCDCSRAEIARAASAPHAGEELVYPGTCRDAPHDRPKKRPPALRLRVPEGTVVTFDDGVGGSVTQDVSREVGDFVLRRGDGIYAYQLAVAVDDATMGIDVVVRGADLLGSTARQLLLMRLLAKHLGPKAREPRYVHLPLVTDADGERLAKRTRGASVRALREAGVAKEVVVGALAAGLGIVPTDAPCAAADVAAALATKAPRWPREPFRIPRRLAELA